MNLFAYFHDEVAAALRGLQAAGKIAGDVDMARVSVELPRDPTHGDLSTNAAMVLSKGLGLKPRDLAQLIADALRSRKEVRKVDIAGPGFINLHLAESFWQARIGDILAAGIRYGDSKIGQGRKVNVEYVSANPTGPLHVAHARGAVYGDALASLLAKAGHSVTKEYYINDAGTQVDVLARSTHLRYREALGEAIPAIPEGFYPGEYLMDVGQALAKRDGKKWLDKPESEWLVPVRQFAIDQIMAGIREDLVLLGIRQDVFSSERNVVESGAVERALNKLEDDGLLYVGVLSPPKGMKPDDWEPRPQTLFRSTDFGDDVDRPLRKSDGSWTYFASDIAYHYDKFLRGCPEMIDVWGADHGGHVKRMKSAVKAVTGGKGSLDVKLCQLVTLLRDGQPVKMAKRKGIFVTLREVVGEVGKGAVRFIMLTRTNDAPLEFDLTKVVEMSRENPVFYVQYAHARACSVLRIAQRDFPSMDISPTSLSNADLTKLTSDAELTLIKQMASWPKIVEAAAEAHEPHRVAFYLHDVASAFHALWTSGTENADRRLLRPDDLPLTAARLAMVQAMAFVIASGLEVMGVEPVEEMR
ncbi:MAG: arginine--tRNA ligase [Dongiaceae bacterium]